MNYCCRQEQLYCGDRNLRRRCFLLAVLYNFIRETSCDLRDMEEDAKEGLQTLPVRLGKQNTLLLMTIAGLVLDAGLTQSIAFTLSGISVRPLQLAYSILRVGLTMAAYWHILKFPRDNHWAWGSVCLLGLVPVLFAQPALIS
jgi:4-hydroxybenzoate polyprenyltransferase